MNMRSGSDHRTVNPFGKNGLRLTAGKVGRLVITDRRKTTGRRMTDNQQGRELSTSTD
jgi:hypothetical protein